VLTRRRRAAVAVWCVTVAACSAGSSRAAPTSTSKPDVERIAQAWIACYERHGIEAVADGDLLDIHDGDMTRSESLAASEECEAELLAAGFLGPDPTSEPALRAAYASFQGQRQCLLDAGFDVDELVPLDVYLQDVQQLRQPTQQIYERDGPAALDEALRRCPFG
jgi:hypothetical protein